MPHIHTQPGQIDFIAEVFIVHQDKVLVRLHDKLKKWIAPGGHIELNETPQEAAVREIKEEVGLDIKLYDGNKASFDGKGSLYRELTLPQYMNIAEPEPKHFHIQMVFFATTEQKEITQPENHEKTECRWLSAAELLADPEIDETVKHYGLVALKTLGV